MSRSLREPVYILFTWCFFCAWVVGYCATQYLPTEVERAAVPPKAGQIGGEATNDLAADNRVERAVIAGEAPRIAMVLGLPAWVFWGIAVPWCLATLFAIYFAIQVMQEEVLDA